MIRHFLKYWLYSTVQRQLDDPDAYLGHSASEQYGRIAIGDQIWFVTVPPRTGRLFMFGHMAVGWIGDVHEAARRLDSYPEELWEATYHILPDPNPAEPYDLVDITDIATAIRFESSAQRDHLQLRDSKVNPQSLQTMRLLTPESAGLLAEIWYSGQDAVPVNAQAQGLMPIFFSEGKKRLQAHYRRERNQALVATAKRQFRLAHGHLYCEVCNFDFSQQYGALGENFIEAHHRQPLAELDDDAVETSIDDLAMVCANCHRMLHHRKPWFSIEELKEVIK